MFIELIEVRISRVRILSESDDTTNFSYGQVKVHEIELAFCLK